jgi:ABC-type glycerol-3-phosphate transport system substrate-binding protein
MNHADFPKGGLVAVVPNESIETFRWYRDLTEVHHVMPATIWVESLGMETYQLLENSKVAMLIEMVPSLPMYEFLTIDWDVAPLPRSEGREPLYFRGGSGGFSISSSSKEPDAAWKFLSWWVSKSKINYPNPMMKMVDFVGAWEKKVPRLKDTHFGDVWTLSEEHGGGDWRNFVRYSSWTYIVFEELLNPKYEQMLNGNISISEYVLAVPEANKRVVSELNKVLSNPNIRPSFKQRIQEEMKSAIESKSP